MKIELKLRDNDARLVEHYLRRRYNSKAKLEKLAMRAIRAEVAAQAEIEADAARAEWMQMREENRSASR